MKDLKFFAVCILVLTTTLCFQNCSGVGFGSNPDSPAGSSDGASEIAEDESNSVSTTQPSQAYVGARTCDGLKALQMDAKSYDPTKESAPSCYHCTSYRLNETSPNLGPFTSCVTKNLLVTSAQFIQASRPGGSASGGWYPQTSIYSCTTRPESECDLPSGSFYWVKATVRLDLSNLPAGVVRVNSK